MTSLKSDVVQLSAQVRQHDQWMSDFERQLRMLQLEDPAGRVPRQAASSEPRPDPARGNGSVHPPKNQGTVLVVGGVPYDTERDVICETLREIFWT